MQTDSAAIRTLLQVYQDLYRAREVARPDEALKLCVPDGETEMVGTEAVRRGDADWALGHDAGRGGFAPPGPRLSTRSPERGRCCRGARARRA
jgi:hypothetical protein